MFLLYKKIVNRLTQIYKDLEVTAMAKYRLQELIQ
jgi:hypothetical protein